MTVQGVRGAGASVANSGLTLGKTFGIVADRVRHQRREMELTSEQAELFPVIARQAAAPSTASVLRSYVSESLRHGFLVPIYLAAEALEVSRQRVHQLIDDGQLAAVECGGRKFIPADALDLFLTEERKTGIHVSRRWVMTGSGKKLRNRS